MMSALMHAQVEDFDIKWKNEVFCWVYLNGYIKFSLVYVCLKVFSFEWPFAWLHTCVSVWVNIFYTLLKSYMDLDGYITDRLTTIAPFTLSR